MSPSQAIEIRQLQPQVEAWVLRASMVFSVVLAVASASTLGASVWIANQRPSVWAAMPGGHTFSVMPIQVPTTNKPAFEAAIRQGTGG